MLHSIATDPKRADTARVTARRTILAESRTFVEVEELRRRLDALAEPVDDGVLRAPGKREPVPDRSETLKALNKQLDAYAVELAEYPTTPGTPENLEQTESRHAHAITAAKQLRADLVALVSGDNGTDREIAHMLDRLAIANRDVTIYCLHNDLIRDETASTNGHLLGTSAT